MLPTDSSFHERYSDYLSRFPSDHVVVVVSENLLCREGGWEVILELEDELQQREVVDRTVSIASRSARFLQATADSIELRRFREVEFAEAAERCSAASSYKPFDGLVSEDKSRTATYVVFGDGVDAINVTETMNSVLGQLQEDAASLGGRLLLSGEPVMSAEVSNMVARDNVYVVLTMCAMLLALWLLTGSLKTVGAALTLTVFTVVGAYGMMGWLDIALTPATSLSVFLLIPLSAAVCIYVRWHVASKGQGSTPKPRSRQAFLLAGVTTAIGFSSTGWTQALDIQHLALLGTVGVVILTIGVFLIAFPLLSSESSANAFRVRIAPPIRLISNTTFCIAIFLIFLGFTSYGLSRVSINYSPTNYMPSVNPVRQDFDEIGKSFGRMALPFVVETENAEDPETWSRLEPLIARLNERYPVGFYAAWFYDHLSEVARGFTLDESGDFVPFPEDSDSMAQLLLLFDDDDLELFMDADRERILIVFHVPFEGSSEYHEFKDLVDNHILENGLDGYFVGRVSAFFEAGHQIGFDTLRGLSFSAGLIFFLMWALLKSFRLAFIGVLVNAIPVFLAISALGALGIDLDLGSSIVAAVAFGIILDDTAHLIFRMRELMRSGYDSSTAVVFAVTGLSTPIFATTCAVSLGFACLFFAEMIPFSDFATVILVAMWGALVTDLLLLPFFVRVAFERKTLSA